MSSGARHRSQSRNTRAGRQSPEILSDYNSTYSQKSALHTEEIVPHVGGQILLPYERLPPARQPLLRVVITGGPCSGKSSCATHFKTELERMGYQVFCLPEVATMIMTAGQRLWLTPDEERAERVVMSEKEEQNKLRQDYFRSAFRSLTPGSHDGVSTSAARPTATGGNSSITKTSTAPEKGSGRRTKAEKGSTGNNSAAATAEESSRDARSELKELLQRRVLQNMLVHEDTFIEIARGLNRPTVILMDRGTLDGSAYCTRSDWESILLHTNYSEEELVEARYDAVLHFVTAADGAEKYYSLENNGTRHETKEEAIQQDAMTRRAWRSFPLVITVDNSTGFEEKLDRAVRQLRHLLPSPYSVAERYTQSMLSDMETRKSAFPSAVWREIKLAQRHTGTSYFAARDGPVSSSKGVQRFLCVDHVEWRRLPHNEVTTKQVSHYFILPDPDGSEVRDPELLIRLIGSVGVFRPVYLRRAKFRAQGGGVLPPATVLRPRASIASNPKREDITKNSSPTDRTPTKRSVGKQSTKGEAVSRSPSVKPEKKEPSTSAETTPPIKTSSPGRSSQRPSLSKPASPVPPGRTPSVFESTVRITEEEFYYRVQHSTPALPLVEKEVFRFVHKLSHFSLIRYLAPEEMKGRVTLAGPPKMTLADLPEWIRASPVSYEDSWLSHELIL